jgi:molybdopterin-guanine dinucleotide biosynthesis protein A
MRYVILAGGKSKRFGENKYFYKINGETMIERVINSLSEDPIIITNRENYIRLRELGLKYVYEDDLSLPCEGPMRGISTSSEIIRDEALVISADLPFLTNSVLMRFIENCDLKGICVPIDGEEYPQFSLIYLNDLNLAVKLCKERKNSLYSLIFESPLITFIGVSLVGGEKSLVNVNYKSDMDKTLSPSNRLIKIAVKGKLSPEFLEQVNIKVKALMSFPYST